jgi:hypothetical protein
VLPLLLTLRSICAEAMLLSVASGGGALLPPPPPPQAVSTNPKLKLKPALRNRVSKGVRRVIVPVIKALSC